MGNLNLKLCFYDGAGEKLEGREVMVTVFDGNQKRVGYWYSDRGVMTIALPLQKNPLRDRFRLIASAKGFNDAGRMNITQDVEQKLMLIAKKASVVLRPRGEWPTEISSLIPDGFEDFVEFDDGLAAACLLNILEAIRLKLGAAGLERMGTVPVEPATEDFRKQGKPGLMRDRTLLQVDKRLIDVVTAAGMSLEPPWAHPTPAGYVRAGSYKQKDFPFGNLQITFFTMGDSCYADIDMDYYRDKASHLLLEVFPNTFFRNKTDPRKVYGLRWMEGNDFKPAYILA